MKPFTTLKIFHGNYCTVHPTILSLKKIVLQEHILTITHKTQPFLLFSAFSHMSSHCQKFKALLTEEEKREWSRSRSEWDWKRRREEQPWHSRTGNGSVSCWKPPAGATEIHQCPQSLGSWALGVQGHQQGREQHSTAQLTGMLGPALWTCRKIKQHQAPHGWALRGSSCTQGWIQGWAGEKGEEMSSWQLPISC